MMSCGGVRTSCPTLSEGTIASVYVLLSQVSLLLLCPHFYAALNHGGQAETHADHSRALPLRFRNTGLRVRRRDRRLRVSLRHGATDGHG